MNKLKLYTFGRCVSKDAWYVNQSRVVNRLYYVNSGTAIIHISGGEYLLKANKYYIIPQCSNFKPLSADNFDHTYFDYYSAHILRANRIYEFDSEYCSANHFFSYINGLIESSEKDRLQPAAQGLLFGFLSALENFDSGLIYVDNSAVKRAVEIIHKNYSDISCKSLSEELHLNESYFIRLFHKAMGVSPMKYIKSCRALNGKDMLFNGVSAKEAAEKCGYSSVSAFYRALKSESKSIL